MRGSGALRLALAAVLLLVYGCTSGSGAGSQPSPDIAVTTLSTPEFPRPVSGPLHVAQRRALQAVLDGLVSDHALTPAAGVRGITAAVVSDAGSWAGAAGTDGRGRPLEPRSMMAIDSITKTFVAAEVLSLAETGAVDLDAPLSTYVGDPLTANGATVRQTLSMRSGVRDPPAARFLTAFQAQAATPAQPWTLREILAHLRARAVSPGGPPIYANTNFLLLGLLVEGVTGRPLAKVERSDLFRPAGLDRIAAQDTERPTAPVAAPPGPAGAPPDGYLPSRTWAQLGHDAFAGLAADAATTARWGYQLYGARLLHASSVRAMTTEPSIESIFPGQGYALGTEVFGGLTIDAAYGHAGVDPDFTSILAVIPERHLAVAVLVPGGGRPVWDFARDLIEALE